MKKVKLELSTHEVEVIICAINDDMENFYEDDEYYVDLYELKLKIREEYEKCIRLD